VNFVRADSVLGGASVASVLSCVRSLAFRTDTRRGLRNRYSRYSRGFVRAVLHQESEWVGELDPLPHSFGFVRAISSRHPADPVILSAPVPHPFETMRGEEVDAVVCKASELGEDLRSFTIPQTPSPGDLS
jgi:hypothetical protein